MNRQIKMQDIVQYTLNDYQFLQDYEVIDSYKSNKNSFVACIRNSEQKVRFVKRKYTQNSLERFKALHKLYKNGIVLCDSLFILQECDQYSFYIIEAEIQAKNPRFQTLQQYLYNSQLNQLERKALLSKVKILIDCLHQQGQYYAGIDTRKIIVDDQKHIYLAPYDLEFQLKTDHFSRAYYSPELLTTISKMQSQINQQMMQRWDNWAFGCIALQILGYSSPYFLSTSLAKQFNQIEKFNVSKHFSNQEQSIRYLLANSLSLDQTKRSLKISQRESQTENINTKQSLQIISQMNKQTNPGLFRQLNICVSESLKSDSYELIFNIVNLKNISFEKQLKISIYVNKVYHIFLDFDQVHPHQYTIHKRITIKETFNYFQSLLDKPVKIQLQEQDKISQIHVHLQALVLSKSTKRVWSQPILGTYTAASGDFSKSKIKINCSLMAPKEDLSKNSLQIDKKPKDKIYQKKIPIKFQQKNGIIQKQTKHNSSEISILKDIFLNEGKKPIKTSQLKLDKIPSISQISEQITLITQGFKRKISLAQAQKQNYIQKKLTSLLKIQSLAE